MSQGAPRLDRAALNQKERRGNGQTEEMKVPCGSSGWFLWPPAPILKLSRGTPRVHPIAETQAVVEK